MLPHDFAWLAREPGPRMLLEALKLYGTAERPGPANNPVIIAWARELGLERVYAADSVPWCGLGMAVVAKRAGWDHAPGGNALWALNWAKWGNPAEVPSLGDVLVLKRRYRDARGRWQTAGHVGQYVAEGQDRQGRPVFWVLGANQSDRVCIVPIERERLVAARRAPWRVAQPPSVRPIRLAAGGVISTNEA